MATEQELLQLLREPSTQGKGFRILVNTYKERVYWTIRRMVMNHDDADDITQLVFIKIFENLNSFRQDSKLFTWIYRIAINETLTFLAQRRRRNIISWDTIEHKMSENLIEDAYFEGDEVQLQLQKAVLLLPEKQRLVFNMKYYEELKYEEIEEILGTSIGALKASYHHAVKKIEEFLNSR